MQALKSRNATGGGWEGWVEGGVGWWAKCGGGEGVQVTRDAWRIWTRRVSVSRYTFAAVYGKADKNNKNGGERAPIAFVQAKELPKGALVEYQVNLHTGRRDYTIQDAKEDEEEDDDGEEELEPVYESGKGQGVWWESCHTSGRVQGGSRGLVFVKGESRRIIYLYMMTDKRRRCRCIGAPLQASTSRSQTGVFALQSSVYSCLPPGPSRSR